MIIRVSGLFAVFTELKRSLIMNDIYSKGISISENGLNAVTYFNFCFRSSHVSLYNLYIDYLRKYFTLLRKYFYVNILRTRSLSHLWAVTIRMMTLNNFLKFKLNVLSEKIEVSFLIKTIFGSTGFELMI